jgi:hypothetical protein
LALVKGNTVLVPLLQHFLSYDGPSVNMTAFRLIAIQTLPNDFWGKLDAKIPIDWQHDEAMPITTEVQLGKTLTPSCALYTDALVGVGGDKPYEWGLGLGLRLNF